MRDKYRDFADLAANERESLDFQVRVRVSRGAPAVIAPHGGGIEPGTSELADSVAGMDFSFYAFEGIKNVGNAALHITSTRFDEPQGVMLVADSPLVIALHGEDSVDPVVFLGGLDKELGAKIWACLEKEGFVLKTHDNPNLQGLDKNNICNRSQTRQGVQLELSRGLRTSFFRSLDRGGRKHLTELFYRFVNGVRKGIFPEEFDKLGD